MLEALLNARFLFRFAVPCLYGKNLWTAPRLELGKEFCLPSFAELDDSPQRVEVRAAWNEQGIAFSATIRGKKQPPWCRDNRIEDSDGFLVWIDTRDTHNIHRASRFCHQFVFLPTGGGHRQNEPVAELLPIHRARENPKPPPRGIVRAIHHGQRDGYRLDCLIPAAALTGFEPADHPRLGFHWAAIDREIGEHTFCCPPGLPYREDPSVWGTLELLKP
ncbi:MAG: hypothetical protein IT427_05435 [Pirellulales bacterium]|nr:hypothetical protein [Pirellulales bacterium]